MSHTPVPVLFDIRCIDHQHVFLRFVCIHQQVVYNSSGFIRKTSVLHLARCKYSSVIGSHFLNKFECMRAFYPKFTHVRYIENTYRMADREMFINNSRIFNRHVVTRKLMHLGSECNMFLGKWSCFHKVYIKVDK